MKKRSICLVAGGTAGHINSAIAMGDYYQERGYAPFYISGDRHLDFKLLEGKEGVHFKGRPLSGKGIKGKISSLFFNFLVLFQSLIYLAKRRPDIVLGAGGYICGPVMVAAYILRIPRFIIEQNGVLGLTNRLLVPIVNKVFLHFSTTLEKVTKSRSKYYVVGNPIRGMKNQGKSDLPQSSDVNIVIFGGSLGATSINQFALELLKENFNKSITIVHQVGNGNGFEAKVISDHVKYFQLDYLDDIYVYYEFADLIICRAGASTIAELRIFKKPVILIPYPHHADKQQFFNSRYLQAEADFKVSILDEFNNFHQEGLAIVHDMVDYLPSNKVNPDIGFETVEKTKESIFKEIENALH